MSDHAFDDAQFGALEVIDLKALRAKVLKRFSDHMIAFESHREEAASLNDIRHDITDAVLARLGVNAGDLSGDHSVGDEYLVLLLRDLGHASIDLALECGRA